MMMAHFGRTFDIYIFLDDRHSATSVQQPTYAFGVNYLLFIFPASEAAAAAQTSALAHTHPLYLRSECDGGAAHASRTHTHAQ